MRFPVGKPSIGEREMNNVLMTLQEGRITQGGMVQQFESLLATTLGSKHVIACASGTAALHLALAALGIGQGDEVLVPDLSYVSTANAVSYTGATPVLVDVDADSWCMSLDDAEHHVSAKTKVILPVHLYGVPCDMDAVRLFAEKYELDVVEDAAEGLGGGWNGQALGTHGLCGTFSFYANKIITCGEGGAVVTDNDDLAASLRLYRGQAQSPTRRFWHTEIGFNYRLTDLAAAVGLAQLGRISCFVRERQRVVSAYRDLLSDILTFPNRPGTAPWLFTGLLPPGTHLQTVESRMAERGIETRPVFVPMHRLPMYARPGTQFPVSAYVADCGISLPTYPDLDDSEVGYIAEMLREAVSL